MYVLINEVFVILFKWFNIILNVFMWRNYVLIWNEDISIVNIVRVMKENKCEELCSESLLVK